MKIRRVGAELFHARADKHEGNVASPTSANAPQMNIPISTHARLMQPRSYATSHTAYCVFLMFFNDLKNSSTSKYSAITYDASTKRCYVKINKTKWFVDGMIILKWI